MVTEQYKKYGLLLIIIFMGIIMAYFSMPYFTGVLGASTIYVLVRKQFKRLVKVKKMSKSLAATLILVEIVLCVLIPSFLIVWLVVANVESFNMDLTAYVANAQSYVKDINDKFGVDLLNWDVLSNVAPFLTKVGQFILDQIESFVINAFVLVFILFFMLTGSESMEQYLYDILPFSEHNKKRVIVEIDKLVVSNAIGIPLLAIAQGAFATLGYFIFGAPSPVFWGLLTCVASILPVIGTGIIWIPLGVFMMFNGQIGGGIGVLAYGVLAIGNIDNYVRFLIQKKLAATHPLITVFGVIIGIGIFGFWGVIIGPLFFSLFFLCFDIYKDQYIEIHPRNIMVGKKEKEENAEL